VVAQREPRHGCRQIIKITSKAYSAEISQRLDEAASVAKAAQACADAGDTKQGIAIALDVKQLVYEVNSCSVPRL